VILSVFEKLHEFIMNFAAFFVVGLSLNVLYVEQNIEESIYVNS